MSPFQAFSKLLHVNPALGNIVLAGLGILAAAAIALSWGNVGNLVPLGMTIVALGVATTLIAAIFRNDTMQTFLAWLVIAGVVVVLGLGLDAMLGRKGTGIAPPLPCWSTMFSETREQCEARLTSTTRVAVVRPTPVPRSPSSAVPPRPRPSVSAPAQRPVRAPSSVAGTAGSEAVQPPSSQEDFVEAPIIVSEPPAREIRPVPLPDSVAVRLSATGTERVLLSDVDRSPARVFTHVFAGDAASRGGASLAEGLQAGGWPNAVNNVEVVDVRVSETQVRYYHEGDASLATALAADLARLLQRSEVPVRDFSALGLSARPGTLEIWLEPGA
ncbi:MAG: hypothetical protein AAFQ54_07365 [Pseudomonadota bacterium]